MPAAFRKNQKLEYRQVPKFSYPTCYQDEYVRCYLQTFIEIAQWVNGKIYGDAKTCNELKIQFINGEALYDVAVQTDYIVLDKGQFTRYNTKEFEKNFHTV